MLTTVSRFFEWDSAHRVMRHESKCSTLHGHRYKAEVVCSAPALDAVDRVIDFGVIKERVGAWIDANWDHTTLVNAKDASLLALLREDESKGKRPPFVFESEPTAERIAQVLFELAQALLETRKIGHVAPELRVERVRVWETPNCYAEVVRDA